jgi:hypothetical protein
MLRWAMGERNLSKLQDLIFYVTWRIRKDEQLDIARLARVVFEVDFTCYRRDGVSLTGSTYIATPHGPIPEGFQDVLAEMSNEGWLRTDASAGRSAFTPDEIALVDSILTGELGERSEQFPGWRSIPNGIPIPYGTALLSRPRLTPNEIAFGVALSEQLFAQREQ